jgi:cytochrome bd-type quinol oxidase subunit 2
MLAANFSGMFESAICIMLHAMLVIIALIYMIRVFISPPKSGFRELPRWLAAFAMLCVVSVCWAVFANDRGDDLSMQVGHYFPVAPVILVLCLAATHFSRRIKKQNKTRHDNPS